MALAAREVAVSGGQHLVYSNRYVWKHWEGYKCSKTTPNLAASSSVTVGLSTDIWGCCGEVKSIQNSCLISGKSRLGGR